MNNHESQILFYGELERYCNISRKYIWYCIKTNQFPPAVAFDKSNCRGWLKVDVDLWLKNLKNKFGDIGI